MVGRICGMDKYIVKLIKKDGCAGCVAVGRMLSKSEFTSVVELDVIDVEINPHIVEEFNIKMFPTTLVYKDGVLLSSFRGLFKKEDLMRIVGNE
jgi:thioredoxin-like negative regulator of GroEL